MFNKKNIFSLDGKIAVVTGGTGNLGPVWAKALKEAGADVAIIDLPGKKIPSGFKSYSADITNMDELNKLHTRINRDLGFVSVLVNNAGIDAPPINHSASPAGRQPSTINHYQKMWEVNVQGLVNCIEEFLPDMKKLKSGSIINIGSLYLERSPDERFYSHMNFDKPWAYGATKAAVDSVTRHFATRLAKYGIRVNTLSPGGVLNNQNQEFVKKYSQKVPLGRMADKKQDLAGPLVFLASDASSYVTGINLQVNGGYTAW